MSSVNVSSPGSANLLLDQAFGSILDDAAGDTLPTAMNRLSDDLYPLRESLSTHEWRVVTAEIAPRHPLAHLLHQDPFTRRGFYKPRGYAGDAKLLDFIYRYPDDDDSITSLGRTLME